MIINYLLHLPKEILVVLMAAAPILELRAAIPYALFVEPKLSPWLAYVLSVFGTWLPTFFIVFMLEHIEPLLRKINVLNTLINAVYKKIRAESGKIKALEFWGLVFFIAIPVPGAGVWTGALAGYLLGVPALQILGASLLGSLIAGVLVMFLSASIAMLMHYTLLGLLVTVVALVGYFLYNKYVVPAKKD